jgi:hypothetical protein
MTVIGFVSLAAARRVHVAFSDGIEASARFRRLSPSAANAVGSTGLRYAVLAVPGAHCIERLATHDVAGGILWGGAPEGRSCPTDTSSQND